jgi:acyl-CoA synthetase (AMP-forming)/AMP-acid ligase II
MPTVGISYNEGARMGEVKDDFLVIEDMPTNGTGKLDKELLREQVAGG